jgi:hypothetical protein
LYPLKTKNVFRASSSLTIQCTGRLVHNPCYLVPLLLFGFPSIIAACWCFRVCARVVNGTAGIEHALPEYLIRLGHVRHIVRAGLPPSHAAPQDGAG